jgi:hypothetical protein
MIPKQVIVILGLSLLLAACNSTPTPTGTAVNSSPTRTQPITQTAAPTGSGLTAQFAAFRSHVALSSSQLGKLLLALKLDGASKNTVAFKNDATSIRAWSKAELSWLGKNPIAGCYASLYTLWDNTRSQADRAAVAALAGTYDQNNISLAITASQRVTASLDQHLC